MKFNTIIPVVVALIVAGGFYYFLQNRPPEGDQQATEEQALNENVVASTATTYEECIAEGNAPLPDAPDKCLTADGHLFIQMPEE